MNSNLLAGSDSYPPDDHHDREPFGVTHHVRTEQLATVFSLRPTESQPRPISDGHGSRPNLYTWDGPTWERFDVGDLVDIEGHGLYEVAHRRNEGRDTRYRLLRLVRYQTAARLPAGTIG